MATMLKANVSICQSVLNQTRSIDETARTMDESNTSKGFRYWREQIIKHIESGELIL